ncbi:hypothetical protein [Aeromicrobium sp.]|uniref:DUF6907 domain-containing protein n=1 Tax=Aeromicrobium sp. TaxID=1871063 RepID=UPI0030C1CC14
MNRDDVITHLSAVLAPYGGPHGWDWESILSAGFTLDRAGRYRQVLTDTELVHACLRHAIHGPVSEVDCPSWCQLPPGHRYDEDADGGLVRWHEATSHQTSRASVEVTQDELAIAPAGPIHRSAISAALYVDGNHAGERFTAEDCRDVAAALLAAADNLENLLDRVAREPE